MNKIHTTAKTNKHKVKEPENKREREQKQNRVLRRELLQKCTHLNEH